MCHKIIVSVCFRMAMLRYCKKKYNFITLLMDFWWLRCQSWTNKNLTRKNRSEFFVVVIAGSGLIKFWFIWRVIKDISGFAMNGNEIDVRLGLERFEGYQGMKYLNFFLNLKKYLRILKSEKLYKNILQGVEHFDLK